MTEPDFTVARTHRPDYGQAVHFAYIDHETSQTMTPPPPRTWTWHPEPGPEITAVRDGYGDLWQRTDIGWMGHGGASSTPWGHLAQWHPLTDASDEPTTEGT